MNLTIIRALLEDARQQVLDNRVFRLLVILTMVPILMTFVVAFREDALVVLWGFEPIYYADLIQSFGGGSIGDPSGIREQFIQTFQSLIVNFFAGSLGVIFCIAATAFFMPRVLEKGAADTLFSKPVSRFAILFSRYIAGLLFIAGIGGVLVLGMFFGFGLRSGYWDAGFLWGAVTLVYLFGLMHAFSICVAVLTRSSTAAILLTVVLFFIAGRVHWGWETIQYIQHSEMAVLMRESRQGATDDAEKLGSADEEDEQEGFLALMLGSVKVLHYTLPKTRDARIITDKLRRALTNDDFEWKSADGELVIQSAPRGFVIDTESRGELEADGVRWIPMTPKDAKEAELCIRRYPRPQVERGISKSLRPQTGRALAKELKQELEEQPTTVVQPTLKNLSYGGVRMTQVAWGAQGDHSVLSHQRLIFHFDQWIYEIDIVMSEGVTMLAARGAQPLQEFLSPQNMTLGSERHLGQDEWYRQQFGWTSPWRYNIFFSLASSLAFASLMLTIAWLRLSRIDF
jgi:ABC-type transport system involved in multi-copper enzyme maturation permease subunit